MQAPTRGTPASSTCCSCQHTCTPARTLSCPVSTCASHLTPVSTSLVTDERGRIVAGARVPRKKFHSATVPRRMYVPTYVPDTYGIYAHTGTWADMRATGRSIGERPAKSLARPIETSSDHLFPISGLLVIDYRLPTNPAHYARLLWL